MPGQHIVRCCTCIGLTLHLWDLQHYAGVAHSMAVAAMLAAFALQPPASIAGLQEAGALEAESSMEVLRGPSPDIPTEFPPLPDIVMPDIEEVALAAFTR